MTSQTPTRAAVGLAPIYLSAMVCSMGMMGFVALAGPLATALGLSATQIGLSAMAGGLGWVLAARAWGRATDQLGRRRVLLVGMTGFAVFYLALCLFAHAGTSWGVSSIVVLAGLVGARFAMGLTYAAVPAAANALIADRFAPGLRAGEMGRLGAAQASGLLLGPAFVVFLAGPSPILPLFLLALLPLPVIALMALRLPLDPPAARDVIVLPLPMTDPRLRAPVMAALAAMLGVGIAQIVVGFVALDRFALAGPQATRLAGGALASVGVALIIAQTAVARLGWTPRRLMVSGGVIASAGFLAAAAAPSPALLISAYALAGFGAGWVFPAISAMAANAVDAQEQGRAAGCVSTALGLGAMLGPLIGGGLYDVHPVFPLTAAGVSTAIVALIGLLRSRASTTSSKAA